MSTVKDQDREQVDLILNNLTLLRAFKECSDELQAHAFEMIDLLTDPSSDSDDQHLAASTLAEILFPNGLHPDPDDPMPGMDLHRCEQIGAEHYPETRAAIAEMDKEEESFAFNLKNIMEEKEITQSELAERLDVGQPAISMMLQRKCRPQRKTVERLAKALNVRPSDLWTGFSA